MEWVRWQVARKRLTKETRRLVPSHREVTFALAGMSNHPSPILHAVTSKEKVDMFVTRREYSQLLFVHMHAYLLRIQVSTSLQLEYASSRHHTREVKHRKGYESVHRL
jgi:hypothetical protein